MAVLPPLTTKLSFAQLMALQDFLREYKQKNHTSYTAMSGGSIGKRTLAEIVRFAIPKDVDMAAICDDAPTWRFVQRIADTLRVSIESIIPTRLWIHWYQQVMEGHEEETFTIASLVTQADIALDIAQVFDFDIPRSQQLRVFTAELFAYLHDVQHYVNHEPSEEEKPYGASRNMAHAFGMLFVNIAALAGEMDVDLSQAACDVLASYKKHTSYAKA